MSRLLVFAVLTVAKAASSNDWKVDVDKNCDVQDDSLASISYSPGLDQANCEVLCTTMATCNVYHLVEGKQCFFYNADVTNVSTDVGTAVGSVCATWTGPENKNKALTIAVTLTPANSTNLTFINANVPNFSALVEADIFKALSSKNIAKGDITIVEKPTQLHVNIATADAVKAIAVATLMHTSGYSNNFNADLKDMVMTMTFKIGGTSGGDKVDSKKDSKVDPNVDSKKDSKVDPNVDTKTSNQTTTSGSAGLKDAFTLPVFILVLSAALTPGASK